MANTARFSAQKISGVVLVLLLCGGGYYFYSQKAATRAKSANLTMVVAEKGDIQDVVTAQGKLEPFEYVDVGAQVSGVLKKLHVQIGDTVKKGDLIAEIDPEIYDSLVKGDEAKLKTLQAQQAQQEAQVLDAKRKLARNQSLLKSNAISREVFEDADTANKVAIAQLDAIKAQIEESQSTLEGDRAKLGYTSIYSPMDGTVVAQTSKEGQTLNSSQSAPTIVQVATLDTMTVRAQVAEADVMKLKPKMGMYFTTLGAGERKWNGEVRQILPTPVTVNDVVLYDVLVDVNNKDRQLMTGMSTQMFFIVGKAENVTVIPVGALGKHVAKEDNDQGLAYRVKVSNNGAVSDKVIHVGLMDRTRAEVKDGLAEGDQVMISAPAAGGSAQAKTQQRGPGGGGPRL
ncbi:MAG: macA [Micavibrio sp.]|nr:macA [Micavibrio sp.]